MEQTILIIEDQEDMREAEASALEAAGFSVLTSGDGGTGLKMALDHKPDLIILDLLLPVMGGQEVLQKLREDDWGETVKVIIATSLDDANNTGKGFEMGISDYIIKNSMSLADIVKTVKAVLSTSS